MKKILVFCAFLGLCLAGWLFLNVKAQTHYGAVIAADAPLVKMADAYGNQERYLSDPVVMQGKITRQCPSSGCWFYLDDASGRQIKVELGHLGLKFPQWVGRSAKIEGRLLQNKEELELVGNGVEFF